MSTEVLNKIMVDLDTLTLDELKILNIRIVDTFKFHVKMNAMKAAGTFNVGDKAYWDGKRGHIEGVVIKIKSKNIDVNAGAMGLWNVTASLLKKI